MKPKRCSWQIPKAVHPCSYLSHSFERIRHAPTWNCSNIRCAHQFIKAQAARFTITTHLCNDRFSQSFPSDSHCKHTQPISTVGIFHSAATGMSHATLLYKVDYWPSHLTSFFCVVFSSSSLLEHRLHRPMQALS